MYVCERKVQNQARCSYKMILKHPIQMKLILAEEKMQKYFCNSFSKFIHLIFFILIYVVVDLFNAAKKWKAFALKVESI